MEKRVFYSKIIYSSGYVMTTIFGYVLSLQGGAIVSNLPIISTYCNENCFNYLSVYRASFALVVYHSILCLCLLGCGSDVYHPRAFIMTQVWPFKFVGWIICFFGSFFIPSSFYLKYWIVTIAVSVLFILIQLLLLVDFACDVADSWISKYNDSFNQDSSGKYKALLISCSSLSYLLTALMIAVLLCYYASCQVNQAVISMNILLVIVITACSIIPKFQKNNPRFGLLQASFISLYGTYLLASALAANDDGSCSALVASSNTSLDVSMKYVGLCFTFLSLGYSAFSTGSSQISGQDDKKVSFSFFHFIFVLAAFYCAGLLTQWTEVEMSSVGGFAFQKGQTSYWIKIASSFASFLLYLWILVAPTLMPDRFDLAN